MITRRTTFLTLAAASVAVLAGPAMAQRRPMIDQSRTPGIGAGGYDVVAFFTERRAVLGTTQFTHQAADVTWRFSTAANRDAFAQNPRRFIPAYGGYCAWAMAQGYTAPGDGRFWDVVDDRLYLNFNTSTHNQFRADLPGMIRRANANWPMALDR